MMLSLIFMKLSPEMMSRSNTKKILTSLFIAILLSGFTGQFAIAQPIEITGSVVEELSNQPIQGANVFLQGSTIGTSTESDGSFSFTTDLTGEHILVISFIGFHTKTKEVVLHPKEPLNFDDIVLRPDMIEMEDVVISADNSEWFDNYEHFKREFIGINYLAQETSILNRWTLDFVRSSSGELYATASSPLILENRGLGYRLEVDMTDFLWELHSDTGFMMFDLQFRELEADDSSERRKWEQNRKRTYQGSLPHFLKSLFNGQLSRNQFQVYRDGSVNSDKIYEARRSRDVMRLLIQNGYTPSDYGDKVKGFHISRPVDILYGQRTIRVDNRKRARLSPQTESGIFLVREDGTFLNPRDIGVEGYWRNERMANKLPTNYRPD